MAKIDQLPTEVLMKIFGYLHSYGNVSLVSRRFYDVACSVPDSVSFSSIFAKKSGNHQSVMDSVQSTRRKISKLSIDFGYIPDLVRESAIYDAVAIVKKFSVTVKRLELRHVRMELSDFLQMLSWLPNAEHLSFTSMRDKRSPTDRQLSDECLNIHRLKTLEFHECSPEFIVAFNKLPAGVLKKLTIEFCTLNCDLLTDLFTQQSNIKQLVLDGYYGGTLPDHIFDHLKLESLEFNQRVYNSSLVLSILSKQTKLIRLRLCRGEADDQTLNVITNQLSELETLDIRVNEAQVVPFKRIEKLKKLKHLMLLTRSLKIIETFAGLDNSRITTLDMNGMYSEETIIPVDVVAALANSLPNLKVLRFGSDCEYEIIWAVMQRFDFLEVLQIRFDDEIDANGLCQTIEVGRCFNPKLTELKVRNFPCDESVLTKLAAVYPNLKILDIESKSSITPPLFKAILTEFKKMESLSLYFYDWSFSTEYVECITEHKNNLKSITLSRFYCEDSVFTVEYKHKLSAVFDVLKYENGTLHLSN